MVYRHNGYQRQKLSALSFPGLLRALFLVPVSLELSR
ncbi:hypothetical protein AB7M37_004883 [Sinorhizobium fredii]